MTNPTELTPDTDVRAVVREKYGLIAEGSVSGCCDHGCGCGAVSEMDALGYTPEQIAAIPDGADLGLGCGNPLAFADAKAGETVLDLGSGAGIDCFLAAKAVGQTGHVIGVDMTPTMIERAVSRPWASALFEGRRHIVTLRLSGARAATRFRAFAEGIESAEWQVPGHFVADITIDDSRQEADEWWVELSALTIEDW